MNAPYLTVMLEGRYTDVYAGTILADPSKAKEAIRTAIFRTHPDRNNGERTDFDVVDRAKRVLTAHHGVQL